MPNAKVWPLAMLNRESVVHSLRTAIAATISLLVARALRLPEAYWAAITTLIVTQSMLGSGWTISGQRLGGTELGAAMAVCLAPRFGPSVAAFTVGIFLMGLIGAALHLEKAAYRFAGVTLAIVMLVPREPSAWVLAVHRFVEVAVGIVVGLLLTALWPDRPAGASAAPAH